MKTQDFFWRNIVEIYGQVFSTLKKIPTVMILFVLIGILDTAALCILFLAPSPPVSNVLAPIIRALWDDRFLHYPQNFLLLPKLFNHAHFLITSVVGIFIGGIMIKVVEADSKGSRISVLAAAGHVFKRYFSILIAWLATYAAFTFSLRALLSFMPANLWLQLGTGFLLGVLLQSLFAFLIPAILILEKGFFRSFWAGLVFGVKHLLRTSGLILIPMLAVTLLAYLKLYSRAFISFEPELVLVVLFIGIGITLAADLLVTLVTTVFFLNLSRGTQT